MRHAYEFQLVGQDRYRFGFLGQSSQEVRKGRKHAELQRKEINCWVNEADHSQSGGGGGELGGGSFLTFHPTLRERTPKYGRLASPTCAKRFLKGQGLLWFPDKDGGFLPP